MRMFRMGYVMVLLTAVLFSMLYTSTLSSVLLTAVILLPFLSLILGFIGSFTIKVNPLEMRIEAEKEQIFEHTVLIENNSFFPVSPVRLTGSFPDETKKLIEKKQLVITLTPFKKMKINFNGVLKYRGLYEVTLDTLECYDILRIFHFKRKLATKCQVQIFPRRLEIFKGNDDSHSEDSEKTLPRRGNDKIDFSSVREYKEGDLMQTVHWKLSAKQDELMVKQYEDNIRTSVALFCDYSTDYTGDDRLLAHDSIIETALAVSKLFSLRERPIKAVSAYSSDTADIMKIDGMNDVDELFRKLSAVSIPEKLCSFDSALSDGMNDIGSESSVCIITAQLTAEKLSQILEYVTPKATDITLLITELEKTPDELLNEACALCKIVRLSANDLPRGLKTLFVD